MMNMKFPTGHYRKLIDFLLLNAYSCDSPGSVNDKTGSIFHRYI